MPDSKRRAHPFAADGSPREAGEAVKGVLVMARLDARAAIAQILRFVVSKKGHGPGANQNDGVGHGDAWRVTGSTSDSWLSLVGLERCRSFGTPCWRSAHRAPVRRPAPRTGLGSS